MKRSEVVLFSALLTACATPQQSPRDQMRVAVLDVKVQSSVREGTPENPVYAVEETGIRTVMENALLDHNITIVDDASSGAVIDRMKRADVTGIHTVDSNVREYQPAATHGIMLHVQDHFSIFSLLTLGLYPVTTDATARLIDLRTGEVRASVQSTSYGILWLTGGPGMAYRAVRNLSGKIAKTLTALQNSDRHLRPQDWPTNYQQDDSNPSAQGRYTHAIFLAMSGGYDDQALDALEEAVRMDKTFADKARRASEFKSLRDYPRFQNVVKKPISMDQPQPEDQATVEGDASAKSHVDLVQQMRRQSGRSYSYPDVDANGNIIYNK